MLSIESCPLPENSLLNAYARSGAYTDCYRTEVTGYVSLERYVNTFYTTLLFKLERVILKWTVSKPSSDSEAMQLATGETDTFAAWHVEERCENQLLLCDFQGNTRSWLMMAPADSEVNRKTRLYFGSAVIRQQNSNKDKNSFGFSVLIGFHKIYSVLLLYSASLGVTNKH